MAQNTSYDPETRTQAFYHCHPDAVRYSFVAADASQPAQESWEMLDKEWHGFDTFELAVVHYRDCAKQWYLLCPLMDGVNDQPVLEQLEPGGEPQSVSDHPHTEPETIDRQDAPEPQKQTWVERVTTGAPNRRDHAHERIAERQDSGPEIPF